MTDLFFTLESPSGKVLKREEFLPNVTKVESAGADDYWIYTADGKSAVYRDNVPEKDGNRWHIQTFEGSPVYSLIRKNTTATIQVGTWWAHITYDDEIIVSRSSECEHPDGVKQSFKAASEEEAYETATDFLYN